jgi:L-rhamnonate dehydratase
MLHLARSATVPVIAAEDAVVVASVSAYVLAGPKDAEEAIGGGGDCHSQKADHWIVGSSIANPMSRYPEYKANRKSWGIDVLGSLVVKVTLSNGIEGVGVSIGGPPACFLVEKHLARFVEGQDPRNIGKLMHACLRSH